MPVFHYLLIASPYISSFALNAALTERLGGLSIDYRSQCMKAAANRLDEDLAAHCCHTDCMPWHDGHHRCMIELNEKRVDDEPRACRALRELHPIGSDGNRLNATGDLDVLCAAEVTAMHVLPLDSTLVPRTNASLVQHVRRLRLAHEIMQHTPNGRGLLAPGDGLFSTGSGGCFSEPPNPV